MTILPRVKLSRSGNLSLISRKIVPTLFFVYTLNILVTQLISVNNLSIVHERIPTAFQLPRFLVDHVYLKNKRPDDQSVCTFCRDDWT